MEQVISLAKQRGFIFPGSEIYGGLANAWDYGPLGAQLRQNIKTAWWQEVVEQRRDIYGMDGAIIMNPKVWEASGHVATFHDPLVECQTCHHRFRSDQIQGKAKEQEPHLMSSDILLSEVNENNKNLYDFFCPDCGGALSEPRDFNLMFKTFIGPVDDSAKPVYLRPETAQAMFVNFKNILQSMRPRLPFGLAQMGKAFRNEITPGNYIFRTLEFEQMEIEYFVEPDQWENSFADWQQWMRQWGGRHGIDLAKLHEYEVPAADRAHYSKRTIDFEFDFPFGRKELWGLAYRTDFDLANHSQASGERLEYTDPLNPQRKFFPHVIEPTMGVDRTLLAMLISAYHEESVNGETRIVLKLKPSMAPYHLAILPLSKKPELRAVAEPLLTELLKTWRCDYDETQSIGKRYRRQDEIGTPLCLTVDFDSLQDHQVTIRQRDSMQQVRLPMAQVADYLHDQMT